MCRAFDDLRGEVFHLINLGWAANARGDYAEAKRRHLEGVDVSRESGERWALAIALIGLGHATCALGEYEASGRHFSEALQTAMEIGALWVALDALVGLASLLTASDEGEAAAEQAVELLAFVLQHPSSSQEAKDRAAPLLAELEGRLTPAVADVATARGQARELEAIADLHLLASEAKLDSMKSPQHGKRDDE